MTEKCFYLSRHPCLFIVKIMMAGVAVLNIQCCYLMENLGGESIKVFVLDLFRHHTSGRHRNGLQRTLTMVGKHVRSRRMTKEKAFRKLLSFSQTNTCAVYPEENPAEAS